MTKRFHIAAYKLKIKNISYNGSRYAGCEVLRSEQNGPILLVHTPFLLRKSHSRLEHFISRLTLLCDVEGVPSLVFLLRPTSKPRMNAGSAALRYMIKLSQPTTRNLLFTKARLKFRPTVQPMADALL
jgi:hypothetical protein